MLRLVFFLALLALASLGVSWLVERPGDLTIVWLGHTVQTSVPVALALLLVVFIAMTLIWRVLRAIFRAPSLLGSASARRKRRKGFEALSRGMIAAGAGDVRRARAAARDVGRQLPKEPLGLLLNAQVAQLSGDREATQGAFEEMTRHPETRLLGLRGLHVEAQRRGAHDEAYRFAAQAHKIAALPWAGDAVAVHHAVQSDWAAALETVEANARAKTIDHATAERQRAVLETAIAQELEMTDVEEALKRAQRAAKRAPDLVPANVLAAKLFARRGDLRAASRLIEAVWPKGPHPDLARAYLDVRPGNSSADRFARAKTLARLAPDHPESAMMLAYTALAMRDFDKARAFMAPLFTGDGATRRMCLLMAEIEEAQNGETGALREWFSRASRAKRDPAWIADGVLANRWAPISPVTGALDAFRWTYAKEQDLPLPGEPILAPVSDSPKLPASTNAEAPIVVAIATADQAILSETPDRAVLAANLSVAAAADGDKKAPIAEDIAGVGVAASAAWTDRTARADSFGVRPVIFPLPLSPDDPGAEREERSNGRLNGK